jgi:hypothetical protein
MWVPVTYQSMIQDYKIYTWDASVGTYGAFIYKDYNNVEINKPIQNNNIGPIEKCKLATTYSLKSDVLGISNTGDNFIKYGLPIDTPYGWDYKENVWVYFTDINKIFPTHYSSYII